MISSEDMPHLAFLGRTPVIVFQRSLCGRSRAMRLRSETTTVYKQTVAKGTCKK